jgi:hypothetical protein
MRALLDMQTKGAERRTLSAPGPHDGMGRKFE